MLHAERRLRHAAEPPRLAAPAIVPLSHSLYPSPAFLDAELSCTDASAASIASLAIRFQHDYLLLLVNAAEPSYSEVRFSFLNLFLYPCRTAAGRSDFSLMSSAALTEAQFPVVISTVW